MQNYLTRSSMFSEYMFCVVVQRIPVAGACCLVWTLGKQVAKLNLVWNGWASFWTIKFSFILKCLTCVLVTSNCF